MTDYTRFDPIKEADLYLGSIDASAEGLLEMGDLVPDDEYRALELVVKSIQAIRPEENPVRSLGNAYRVFSLMPDVTAYSKKTVLRTLRMTLDKLDFLVNNGADIYGIKQAQDLGLDRAYFERKISELEEEVNNSDGSVSELN